MADEVPGQTAEGRLIEEAARVSGRSTRQLAANAGMSDTRWRQIVRGYQQNPAGKTIEARASAPLLARMAVVLNLSPDNLRDVGRDDAARVLADLITRFNPGDTVSFRGPEGATEMIIESPSIDRVSQLDRIQRGDAGTPFDLLQKVGRLNRQQPDEIDLIYASNMSAREKLLRIRQVLELRAQAELEEAREREKAPAPDAEASEDGAPTEAQPS